MTNRNHSSVSRVVLQSLESLAAAGVGQIPKSVGRGRQANSAGVATAAAAAPAVPAIAPVQPALHTLLADDEEPPAGDISAAPTLEILRDEVAACTRCQELASTRTQTVFGVGNPRARLCMMGEAPGADEDRLGEPFVGRAGQLLNKILEACQLRREDVYILNVLKCRPPGNRNPLPDEAANCRRFLNRQLQLIEPEYICCLGAVAAQNLLETQTPIGKLRGRVHDYRGIKVVCTYHPAYLLRNPSAKVQTWEDMKLLMREMGTPVD